MSLVNQKFNLDNDSQTPSFIPTAIVVFLILFFSTASLHYYTNFYHKPILVNQSLIEKLHHEPSVTLVTAMKPRLQKRTFNLWELSQVKHGELERLLSIQNQKYLRFIDIQNDSKQFVVNDQQISQSINKGNG